MAGIHDLYNAARELLEACVEAVEATPGGPITHAYVSPGPPSFDIVPQLTVHVAGSVEADTLPLQPPLGPGHRIQTFGAVYLAPLVVTVLRASPVIGQEGQQPTYPSVEEHEEAAQETCGDMWAIWNHLANKKRAELLFPPREREFWLDPAVAINQQGGACGWAIQVRVQLGGYKEVV